MGHREQEQRREHSCARKHDAREEAPTGAVEPKLQESAKAKVQLTITDMGAVRLYTKLCRWLWVCMLLYAVSEVRRNPTSPRSEEPARSAGYSDQ